MDEEIKKDLKEIKSGMNWGLTILIIMVLELVVSKW